MDIIAFLHNLINEFGDVDESHHCYYIMQNIGFHLYLNSTNNHIEHRAFNKNILLDLLKEMQKDGINEAQKTYFHYLFKNDHITNNKYILINDDQYAAIDKLTRFFNSIRISSGLYERNNILETFMEIVNEKKVRLKVLEYSRQAHSTLRSYLSKIVEESNHLLNSEFYVDFNQSSLGNLSNIVFELIVNKYYNGHSITDEQCEKLIKFCINVDSDYNKEFRTKMLLCNLATVLELDEIKDIVQQVVNNIKVTSSDTINQLRNILNADDNLYNGIIYRLISLIDSSDDETKNAICLALCPLLEKSH